jgi:hypothetical protein
MESSQNVGNDQFPRENIERIGSKGKINLATFGGLMHLTPAITKRETPNSG